MAMLQYEPTYMTNPAVHTPFYSDAYRVPLSYGYGRRAPSVELLVPMCCTKCQEKIRENMLELRGVQGVIADLQAQRVVVTGFVDPLKALKKAKKVKRDSQLWTGAPYAGQYLSSGSKYRRSEHRPSSMYRTSSYEYRPSSFFRTSSLEHRPAVTYRTSYNQYTPSYGGSSHIHRPWPLFESSYSHAVTNPHYVKHIESE